MNVLNSMQNLAASNAGASCIAEIKGAGIAEHDSPAAVNHVLRMQQKTTLSHSFGMASEIRTGVRISD
jgi:hypothetical protein